MDKKYYYGLPTSPLISVKGNEDLWTSLGGSFDSEGVPLIPLYRNTPYQYGRTLGGKYFVMLKNPEGKEVFFHYGNPTQLVIDFINTQEKSTIPELVVTPKFSGTSTEVAQKISLDTDKKAKEASVISKMSVKPSDNILGTIGSLSGMDFFFNPFTFSENVDKGNYTEAALQAALAHGLYGPGKLLPAASRIGVGAYGLASPEGILKTYKEFLQGNIWKGLKSTVGDLFNVGLIASGNLIPLTKSSKGHIDYAFENPTTINRPETGISVSAPIRESPIGIYNARVKSKGGAPKKFSRRFNTETELGMNDAIAYLRTNYLKYANMTNEEVKLVLIDSPYATIGNVLFERPSKYLDRTKGLFKVHETEHSMHIPEEKALGIDFGKLKPEGKEPDYWERNNNTEIGARVAQVLTAQGIRTARIFTGDSLKLLFIKYLSNNGNPDNEISKLYNAVTNWHKFAKWVNNPKNVYSMVGLVTAGSLIKNNK